MIASFRRSRLSLIPRPIFSSQINHCDPDLLQTRSLQSINVAHSKLNAPGNVHSSLLLNQKFQLNICLVFSLWTCMYRHKCEIFGVKLFWNYFLNYKNWLFNEETLAKNVKRLVSNSLITLPDWWHQHFSYPPDLQVLRMMSDTYVTIFYMLLQFVRICSWHSPIYFNVLLLQASFLPRLFEAYPGKLTYLLWLELTCLLELT